MDKITAQARKELLQIGRDRITLVFALLLPALVMVLIGLSISLKVTGITLAVQDLDKTPQSRAYIDALSQALSFQVIFCEDDPEMALARGQARAGIIIPPHFARAVLRDDYVRVQLVVDATDANTAQIVRDKVKALTAALSQRPAQSPIQSLVISERFCFNPGLETDRFVGPGVFAVVLALFPPLLAALAVARESEQGTILQVYASGISAWEYITGKVLAYFIVALAEWAITLPLAIIIFDLDFKSHPLPLLIGTLCYLFCNVSCGVMIGCAIPDQAAAIQATQIGGFVLSFLLSGLIYPIENIPSALRWFCQLVPATHYIELARDSFARGGGWPAVWPCPLILLASGLLFFTIAWIKMRRMKVG